MANIRTLSFDAIIVGGGGAGFADGNGAVLVRGAERGKQYSVRLRDLVKRGDISANVQVRPGAMAGAAAVGDNLPGLDTLPLVYRRIEQVTAVHRRPPVSAQVVANPDVLPAGLAPPVAGDVSIRDGKDGRVQRAGDVNARRFGAALDVRGEIVGNGKL